MTLLVVNYGAGCWLLVVGVAVAAVVAVADVRCCCG